MHCYFSWRWLGHRKRSPSCSSVSKAVKTDLSEAGFITNDEKSIWEPCQRIDWLGLTWDSAWGTIEIVDRRCAKILGTIDSIQFVDSGFVISGRNLASFTGKLFLHHQFPGTSPQSWLGTAFCPHRVFNIGRRKLNYITIALKSCIFAKQIWIPSRFGIVSSFINLSVLFIPMRVLLGVVQWSPLMRNIFAIDFGSHPKVQLGESLSPLINLLNHWPQFWRVPLLSGLRIVSRLQISSKWEAWS